MKKLNLFVMLFIGFCITCTAQENSEKNNDSTDNKILPNKGDIAIGISAMPFLNYLGNLFNGSYDNLTSFTFIENNTIYVKYYLKPTTAIRFKARIGLSSTTLKNKVINDTNQFMKVTDEFNRNTQNILIGGGLEKKRGKNKLYGIYGVEGWFSVSGSSQKYKYGNEFSETNQSPLSTSNFKSGYSNYMYNRPTESTESSTTGIGLRGFIGLEYFIFSRISIGGEFGWGVTTYSYGKSKNVSESWDYWENVLIEDVSQTDGGSFFGANTDNIDGLIYMMFHF